jgi:phage terminase large subunit GpA-like protein
MTNLLLDPRILDGFRQPERLSVSEWADEHRVLDNKVAAEPGRWRTDRAPYAREWMDSASTKWVRRVTIMASTQVGKTEAANNVIGYFVSQQPAPIMMVLPRADDAKVAQARRIVPMIDASTALRAELTPRAHDVSQREIVFRRSIVYFRAAQSPADLASVPVRVVLGDETDKWPSWSGREASPLALVRSRTNTFPRSYLVFLTSTPTTRGGLITKEFEDGDQRRFYVPCPHCGRHQVLSWPNLHWDSERIQTAADMRLAREAWFDCVHCAKRIEQKDKARLLGGGIWVPRRCTVEDWVGGDRERDRVEHRSYHLWAAYSPWLDWWRLAASFLKAKAEGPAEMMDFTNSWLAEVWEDRLEHVGDEALHACVEQRAQGDVPEDVLVVTAAVDVQLDRLEWSVQGWGRDEETWVLATGRAKTFDELTDVLIRTRWGKGQLAPRAIVIDSRYRRDEVLDWSRRHQPVVRMIAGVERDEPIPFSTKKLDRHPRTGQVLPNSTLVWSVNVSLFKDMVAARLELARSHPNERGGRIHLPNDLPADWLTQLGSEHKVMERSGGRERSRWVKKPGHQRNEAWDLTVYNLAAARMVRVDTLRSDVAAPTPRAQPPQRQRRHNSSARFPHFGAGGR